MNRLLFAIAMMASVAIANAADYDYLVFKSSDGTSTSLNAVGLTITFSDGNLVATDGTTTTTLSLSSLSSMYFSNTSGIAQILGSDSSQPVSVYTVAGAYVGEYNNAAEAQQLLSRGVYVLKSKGQTLKMAVK